MMHLTFSERYARQFDRYLKGQPPNIREEWRGWNFYNDNLCPPYDDIKLSVSDVASCYCPTRRDFYLYKVEGMRRELTFPAIEGIVYHDAQSKLIQAAQDHIREKGVEGLDVHNFLREKCDEYCKSLDKYEKVREGLKKGILTEARVNLLKANVVKLWHLECSLIASLVNYHLARSIDINVGTILDEALPLVTERKLNGSKLGLSDVVSVDAMKSPVLTILEMKTGKRRLDHRLTTAGYALVYEAETQYPTNVGCIIYPRFRQERYICLVEHDPHFTTESFRMNFADERNRKAEIVAQRKDPSKPEHCPSWCGYYAVCNPRMS